MFIRYDGPLNDVRASRHEVLSNGLIDTDNNAVAAIPDCDPDCAWNEVYPDHAQVRSGEVMITQGAFDVAMAEITKHNATYLASLPPAPVREPVPTFEELVAQASTFDELKVLVAAKIA